MDGPTEPREVLVGVAQHFYHQGWMMGTAGNLSLRLSDGSIWITASGKPKGRLGFADFLRISPTGEILERGGPDDRPSAEISLHQAIYRLFPQAGACFHVHSIPGNLAARLADGDTLRLPPLEMLKGLGIWEQDPDVSLAVLPNHLHVSRIAEELTARFEAAPPAVPGFLIRDHGLTAWGADAGTALNHVELFEYLFGFIAEARRLRMDG